MSDSDDTDILLLIPPDFFLAEGSFRENSAAGADLMSFSSIELPTTIKARNSSRSGSIHSSQHNHLLRIDRQIADLEREPILSDRSPYGNRRGDCQQWTANNSYDTDYCAMNGTSPVRQLINHSTPKQSLEHNGNVQSQCRLDFGATPTTVCYDEKFLKEIDHYLGDSNASTTNTIPRTVHLQQPLNNVRSLAVETLKRHNSMLNSNYGRQSEPYGIENNSRSLREINVANVRPPNARLLTAAQQQAEPLISLSDIWGPDGVDSGTVTMHEERLRRQHCEREIQVLQTRLLEYQQKIAVAMKIDKSKDEAITRLQDTNARYFDFNPLFRSSSNFSIYSLATKIDQMEITISGIENRLKDEKESLQREAIELRQKNRQYENELFEALSMAKSAQERNESLEVKVETLAK